jgi:enamine deaminase RidA (YjgF/YER057c/UK114 family)
MVSDPFANDRRREGRGVSDNPRAAGAPSKTSLSIVNPPALGRPTGFSHGVLAPGGWHTLYVAGQNAADEHGTILDASFVAQFTTALDKVLHVVNTAGGDPSHIARMTIYVTNLDAYRASRPALGVLWAQRMGRHYPAIALLVVAGLVDAGAEVEIEADAVLPPHARAQGTD